MLDRKLIRDHPEQVQQALNHRGHDFDLESFLRDDQSWREKIQTIESLKAEKNKVSELIAAKKKNKEDCQAEIDNMRTVGEKTKLYQQELTALEDKLSQAMLGIPNIPHESVPVGADEQANVEIRQWGEKPTLAFAAKPHWELGEQLGLFDLNRAAKISGSRFAVYTGVGARLERALVQYMLDVQTLQHGYREIFPPLLVNRDAMIGTGQLPKMENDMFKTSEDELYLIPTAEVPVTNLHRQEILAKEELPLYYAAYTPCFRREAGSYGKDTKGIVRQHQFNKVELVKIVKPETSYDELDKLVNHAEVILQQLNLHYRVMVLSTGDMSFAAAKGVDLEVWHSGTQRYWEVSSCSNFEAFQARRANIRYKDENNKVRFCHTLNGSGLATSRLLPAIIENYQQADGSIMMPEVLRPYLGGKKKITATGAWA